MNRAEKRRQQKLAEKAARSKSRTDPVTVPVTVPVNALEEPVQMDAQQTLNLAIQHHSNGDLAKAEDYCQQVLQAAPGHQVATHLLAMIAHQAGNAEGAVELLSQLLANNPDYAEAHNSLGIVFKKIGRLEEAIASYRKAIAINPAYGEAHYNLGNAFQDQGNPDQAVTCYRQCLTIDPGNITAHHNLGNALRMLGRLDEAAACYRQVLAINPAYAEAFNNLGSIDQQQGKLAAAVDSYHKAIAINPDYAEALSNLGNALYEQGKPDQALPCYQKAVSINPHAAGWHFNLANTLKELGRADEAMTGYRTTIAIDPGFENAHFNLANALLELGNADEAVTILVNVIALNPRNAEAHINLGNAYSELREIDKAVDSFRKALAINPDLADGHYNLGNALLILGQPEDAAASFKNALSINPENAEAFNNLGNAQHELGQHRQAQDNYRRALALTPDYAVAHSNLIFLQDLIPATDQVAQQKERKAWNDTFIGPLAATIQPHTNERDPKRPLRIGYVSADFRRHSACLGFSPLIIDHDRQNFDVTCYDATIDSDDVSATLRAAVSRWRDIKNIDDGQLADTIRADGIDILVDLSGHTRGNRLRVFGHKPAPVQVSGIGHLAPGISTIDYRLTTAQITPPEEEAIYPEQPVYLNTYFGFTSPDNPPLVGPLPYRKNGFITFGFLGRYSKISDQTLSLWGNILQAVPGSRMVLKFSQLDNPAIRQQMIAAFAALGVGEQRLTLLGHSQHLDHLESHNLIDMFLDTVPHGGGITALECLWMGVPVVGLVSPKKAGGRIIRGISHPLDLDQFASTSHDNYHAIALQWAEQPEQLADLRQHLRQRVNDVYGAFGGDVEKSYRLIWQRWCKGEQPTPLYPLST